MPPIVSVIMAAYNAERHISASIESIINQTFKEFELIVINDGSTDGTKTIVESFCKKEPRIKLINNNENLFVIESRNIGIRKAKGKYIAILDSDDLAFPNRLEIQVEYLENNPYTFLIGSSAVIIDDNNNYVRDHIAVSNYNTIKKYIHKDNLIFHSTAMFRNEQFFYRQKMLFSEDYDFILCLISSNKVINNLPEKLVKYRLTQNSLSRKDNRLTQWLFINKTREFFKERLTKGKDSYDNFDSKSFSKIMDINYPIKKQDLLFASKICIYRSDLKTLQFLLKKYKRYYSPSLFYIFYFLISQNDFIFNLFHKIYSKL